MKRDTVVVILIVIVITAAMATFVWWRSAKSLMSSESQRDGLQPPAMLIAQGS